MEDKNANRFIIEDESAMLSPKDNILCKNCIFRSKEFYDGFKNSRCEKYVNESKPLDILFNNGLCKYYKEDKNL